MNNKLFNHIFRIYLVVSMWFFIPGMMSYKPQEMFIQYGAMLFFGLSLITKPIRQINNKWLFVLFLSIFVNTLLFRFDSVSRMGLVDVFLGLVTIKIIAERFDLNYKAIGTTFLLFIIANLILLGLQVKNIDPIFTNVHLENMKEVDHVGFMGARYALGCLAAFSVPFLYSLNPWSCLSVVPLLVFGKSSTSVIACGMVFSFLAFFDVRRWVAKDWKKMIGVMGCLLLIMVGAIYYVFFMDMPTGQFEKRLVVWFACVKHFIAVSPYIGLGLGKWAASNFVGLQSNGEPEGWKWVHNEFLQFAFEQGIIGVSILSGWLWHFIKNLQGRIERSKIVFASFLSLMVLCCFHFPFHARFVGVSLFIVALMEIQISGEKHEKSIIDPNSVASI